MSSTDRKKAIPKTDAGDQPVRAGVKDTNPKDAVGTKRVPFSVLSMPVMAEVGIAMLEGARKYGRHNYRVAGVRGSVYVDAAMRHLASWWEGQDLDPDPRSAGLSHITKAIAGLTVLRDAMIHGKLIDDRPPKTDENWLLKLNTKAAEVVDIFPDAVPAYVEGDQYESKED